MLRQPSGHAGRRGFSGRQWVPMLCAALCVAGVPAHARPAYTMFDVPQATAGTLPASINDSDVVAGNYEVYSNFAPGVPEISHGFVRAADGTIATFDPQGSTGTTALRINDSGTIAGWYDDGNNVAHGFLRAPDGTITTIDAPGETGGTYIDDINAKGATTGAYVDGSGAHGFMRTPGGKFTTFDISGGSLIAPDCISDKGWIAGEYQAASAYHGFVRAPDGRITTFDPSNSIDTQPSGIDSKGVVVGWYADNYGFHGFLRAAQGSIAVFDASQPGSTMPRGINAHGEVAGQTGISRTHGFLRSRAGKVKNFSPPNSIYSDADAINDAGTIIGYFQDRHDKVHGYLRSR